MAAVKLVDELREAFTECSICMTDYTSPPKMLTPCLHTFCLACLERHASCVRSGDPLLCPTCRTPVNVPEDGLAALPTNFFVNRLRDSLRESRSEATVNREVCAAHPDKAACFFCRSCDEVICAGCMLTAGHRDHDCIEIEEAAAAQKKVILQVTADATERLGKLRLHMTAIEGLKSFAEQLLARGSKTEYIQYAHLLRDRLAALSSQPLDVTPTCMPMSASKPNRKSVQMLPRMKARPSKVRCSFLHEFHARNEVCDGNSFAVIGDEIYICARSSGIDVYSQQGEYKRSVCDSHFRSVGAITPLGASSFAVCDRGAQVVFKLSASGSVEQVIGRRVLKWPVGVAISAHGHFLVTDVRMKCVHVFNSEGIHMHSQMGDFERPISVASGHGDVMMVTDADRHKVQWISASGELLHSYGSQGDGEHQFGQPLSVIRDLSGHVLVSDNKGHRVHRLTPEGAFLQYALTEEDGIEFPNSLFFDPKTSRLYVGQSDGKVKVFTYSE